MIVGKPKPEIDGIDRLAVGSDGSRRRFVQTAS